LTSDGQLPLDEQLARFEQTLRHNRTLTEVLARAATLDLPGWYLVAGCLYLAPPEVYRAKTGRWRRQWPALTVLPWPATA